METTDILDKMNSILNSILKKDTIRLTEATTAQDVDGWDSLTHMLIINDIETAFDLQFSFREIAKFKNVGDICKAIQAKKD